MASFFGRQDGKDKKKTEEKKNFHYDCQLKNGIEKGAQNKVYLEANQLTLPV